MQQIVTDQIVVPRGAVEREDPQAIDNLATRFNLRFVPAMVAAVA